MAQLKDLIVTGPARIIGTLYAQNASTDLAGLVKLGGGTTNFLRADGTWAAPPNDEGVTNVAASGSDGITISGSPITSTGTIAIGLNLSTAINGLSEGTSPAEMNDYAVIQYAGGGTTTTTYHRRKLSNILTKSNIEAGLGYVRGAANGVAPLNANSKIDATYLPSYVDDVLEYEAKANFPSTGEDGKIYIDKTTNLTWRWGGSAYVEISPSLALGSTSSTAAAGNHVHGNITNDGDITATAPTIASGDQLIINDHSASKITNGPTFDGSTTTTALTPKGTWETFVKTESDPVFSASAAAGITSENITDWNKAFSGYNTLQWNSTSEQLRMSKNGTMTTLFSKSDLNIPSTAADVGAATSSHTHGNITNSGDITTNVAIASGDRIVINDESASKINNSSITFGSNTDQYLANNGTWQTLPAQVEEINIGSSQPTDSNTKIWIRTVAAII